ncbi:MAG: heparan-alpha-glucosaminide N-acetyltransferase [Rhodobacteraceae bacterium]|nr:heparan-alpha-glucosaminide N-acetyltransferase [Paracoccaceae bacterium]
MQTDKRPGRIPALDLARTLALIGMVRFHFGFDLESFGVIAPGTMESGFWWVFARIVAGSFLFMAGISLWLAHGQGIRWRGFVKRLVMIMAAAALVTWATHAALGEQFVFFGILHSIALSSLIGLVFLRVPALLTLLAAAAAAAAPDYLRSPAFDAPWFWWTGLSDRPFFAVDYVPTLPWLAPVLAGIAFGRIDSHRGLWDRLRTHTPGPVLHALTWPGRHSLAVYLIHQPVLITILTAMAKTGLL